MRANALVNRLALSLIGWYQRFISPYKGFRCAYAVLYADDSCSEAVKKIVAAEGIINGLPQIRARFQACSAAYGTIKEEESDFRRCRKKGDRCAEYLDCCEPDICELRHCLPSRCGSHALSTCENGCCDAGWCDVGSCDCSL